MYSREFLSAMNWVNARTTRDSSKQKNVRKSAVVPTWVLKRSPGGVKQIILNSQISRGNHFFWMLCTKCTNESNTQSSSTSASKTKSCMGDDEMWHSANLILIYIDLMSKTPILHENHIILYQDGCLLTCCVMQSGRHWVTFHRSLLPPSSGHITIPR
jgi:hypothetical protein